MTKLPSRSGGTFQNPSINANAAANACSQNKGHYSFVPFALAKDSFLQGQSAAIVDIGDCAIGGVFDV